MIMTIIERQRGREKSREINVSRKGLSEKMRGTETEKGA